MLLIVLVLGLIFIAVKKGIPYKEALLSLTGFMLILIASIEVSEYQILKGVNIENTNAVKSINNTDLSEDSILYSIPRYAEDIQEDVVKYVKEHKLNEDDLVVTHVEAKEDINFLQYLMNVDKETVLDISIEAVKK